MPQIVDLIWDEWNEAHIARHGVEPEEVEEVSLSVSSLAVRTGKDRYHIFGQTGSGRYLTVILDREDRGLFYPVTARGSTQNEVKRLRRWRGA